MSNMEIYPQGFPSHPTSPHAGAARRGAEAAQAGPNTPTKYIYIYIYVHKMLAHIDKVGHRFGHQSGPCEIPGSNATSF